MHEQCADTGSVQYRSRRNIDSLIHRLMTRSADSFESAQTFREDDVENVDSLQILHIDI